MVGLRNSKTEKRKGLLHTYNDIYTPIKLAYIALAIYI